MLAKSVCAGLLCLSTVQAMGMPESPQSPQTNTFDSWSNRLFESGHSTSPTGASSGDTPLTIETTNGTPDIETTEHAGFAAWSKRLFHDSTSPASPASPATLASPASPPLAVSSSALPPLTSIENSTLSTNASINSLEATLLQPKVIDLSRNTGSNTGGTTLRFQAALAAAPSGGDEANEDEAEKKKENEIKEDVSESQEKEEEEKETETETEKEKEKEKEEEEQAAEQETVNEEERDRKEMSDKMSFDSEIDDALRNAVSERKEKEEKNDDMNKLKQMEERTKEKKENEKQAKKNMARAQVEENMKEVARTNVEKKKQQLHAKNIEIEKIKIVQNWLKDGQKKKDASDSKSSPRVITSVRILMRI